MIEHIPAREARTAVELPVVEVTVLEDRAIVTRRGRAALGAGTHRLTVDGVAPPLHDLSLQATSDGGRVGDARVCRAMRVRREDRPDAVRALEAQIREQVERFEGHREDRQRAEEQLGAVQQMLAQCVGEIPEDAAWGVVDPDAWEQTFQTLFARARKLADSAVGARHQQLDCKRTVDQLVRQRQLADSPSVDFVAWVDLDLHTDQDAEVVITLTYTTPNALWRPIHRARLVDDRLSFTGRAAVWQRTGEDWTQAQLTLSTARSSLGTEPPLLRDDLLEVERRSDELNVEVREVEVQRGSVDGPGSAPSRPTDAVELPGVDDGGEVRRLAPEGPVSVPSTGAPVFFDLFTLQAPAEAELVVMPEVDRRAHLRCVATHTGGMPLLAGPVELVRGSGAVGWSRVLYVAPGDRFELGFGPDDAVQVHRDVEQVSDDEDAVDNWRRMVQQVDLFVSNTGATSRVLRVVERVPVAEIEQVRVAIDDTHTSGSPTVDDDGFVRWALPLEPHARARLRLRWSLAFAPGVDGSF